MMRRNSRKNHFASFWMALLLEDVARCSNKIV